nr:unnamed protein product [Callosobruchus chinensis]
MFFVYSFPHTRTRKCGEAVETAKHVIFDCPALCRRRRSYLEVVQEEGRQYNIKMDRFTAFSEHAMAITQTKMLFNRFEDGQTSAEIELGSSVKFILVEKVGISTLCADCIVTEDLVMKKGEIRVEVSQDMDSENKLQAYYKADIQKTLIEISSLVAQQRYANYMVNYYDPDRVVRVLVKRTPRLSDLVEIRYLRLYITHLHGALVQGGVTVRPPPAGICGRRQVRGAGIRGGVKLAIVGPPDWPALTEKGLL